MAIEEGYPMDPDQEGMVDQGVEGEEYVYDDEEQEEY